MTIPENESIFAQNMFCMSLTGEQINDIVGNLIITNAQIYYEDVDTTMAKYENLRTFVDKKASAAARKEAPD